MRDFVGGALLLACLAAMGLGLIALIWPLPKLGLGRRWRSATLIFGAFLLTGVATTILPNPPAPTPVDQASAPGPSTQATPALAVGDHIASGPIEVTVTKVGAGKSIPGAGVDGKASEGGLLVGVSYALKNVSTQPVKAYDLPRPQLVDPTGVRYNPDDGKTAAFQVVHPGDRKLTSDLNPGITVRDTEIFEVSSAAFDATTWTARIGDGPPIRLASAH